MSTAVPSFKGRAVSPEEDAVGVERSVGRERYVPPPLPPVLVPESYASLPDEPLTCEPPLPDVDELSWS
ncbi:hypothetical protein [Streptomyces sp. NPDC058964]|uniref:hypothetical protein n=1 Tax=Streptomyces sp. NPDC058964 TaxID=3346681 RepID=UPI0036749E96